MDQRRIVGIGGGSGAPVLLRALQRQAPDLHFASVVPSTDIGRSTGTARRALRIPAPGDLRHALATLASGTSHWAEILEQRLDAPEYDDLNGMAVGNLILGALAQASGSIGEAALLLGRLLGTDTPVLPVSIEDIHLGAVLEDGTVLRGEVAVRGLNKPRIARVFIEGERDGVWNQTAEVMRRAAAVIIGPGSLWTSLGATLSVHGVREAVLESGAPVFFVCNTTTQSGQTDGLNAAEHVAAIAQGLGRMPDVVVLNTGEPVPELRAGLTRDGLIPLQVTAEIVDAIESAGSRVIVADLLERSSERPELWNKQDTAYHDMDRTAALLLPALRAAVERATVPAPGQAVAARTAE